MSYRNLRNFDSSDEKRNYQILEEDILMQEIVEDPHNHEIVDLKITIREGTDAKKQKVIDDLTREIGETLERHYIDQVEDLLEEIKDRKMQIANLEQRGGSQKQTLRKKASLKELEELHSKIEYSKTLRLECTRDRLANTKTQWSLLRKDQRSQKISNTLPHTISILDELRDMQSDISNMPHCSERAVITLLCSAVEQIYNEGATVQSEEEIEDTFQLLKSYLCTEELNLTSLFQIVDQSFIFAKNKDWVSVYMLLKKLLKQLRPLNVPEILRLVEKSNSAVELVKDQNIILFLGETGSGKSTTIHYLSGSKMIETVVDGMPHIGYSEVRNSDLNNVKTSPSSRSETRYISSVRVNPEDVGATFDDPVYLCDTPGFGDTAESEVDIANGAGMIMAIRGCKSVKPVVLISYKSVGDQMTGLKKIIHLLAAMIPEMNEYSKAFSFFFTKYPNRDKDGINATLRNIKKNLNEEEEVDEGFKILINRMIQKTANRPATTIDPLGGNPIAILNDLMDSEAIKRPDEVFRFSLTEKSKAEIQLYLQIQQSSILKAADRSDYTLAIYKMNELRQLYQILQQNTIDQVYGECVSVLSKRLDAEYNSSISAISRGLALQSELTHEDVRCFSESIKAAEHAEHLRKMHLNTEVVSSDAYMKFLRKQVHDVVSAIEQKEVDDLLVKTNLDKIVLIANIFAEFELKYEHARQTVLQKLGDSAELFRTLVSHGEFDKSTKQIHKISHCLTSLAAHLDQSAMQQKYDDAKSYLMNAIQASIQKVDHLFEHETLTKENVEALEACLLKTRTILKDTLDLHPHIDLPAIQMMHDSLVQKIVNYFDQINAKINGCFIQERESSLPAIEALINEMIQIRIIQEIEYKTAQSYHSTIEMVFGFTSYMGREVEHILDKKDSTDYSRLYKCLNSLKMAKWLENLRPTAFADLVRDVDEKVLQHASELESCFKAVSFSLENSDSLKTAYKTYCQLNMMTELQEVIPNLVPIINGATKLFIERAQCEFEVVEASLEKWSQKNFRDFDWRQAEDMHKYLTVCKEVDPLSKKASALLGKLCDAIKEYTILKQIKELCKDITDPNQKTFKYEEILNKTEQNITKIPKEFEQAGLNEVTDTVSLDLRNIESILKQLSGYPKTGLMQDLEYCKTSFDACSAQQADYFSSIEASLDKTDCHSEQQLQADQDLKALKNYLSKIPALNIHPESVANDTFYSAALETINDYTIQISTKIINLLTLEEEDSFSCIERLVRKMIGIQKIPIVAVRNKTAQCCSSTFDKLFGSIEGLTRAIDNLYDKEDMIDSIRLFRHINNLKRAKWLEKLHPIRYSQLINNLDKKLIEHANELKTRIKKICARLENVDNLRTAHQLVSKINAMKQLQETTPALTPIVDEANSLFIKNTQYEFDAVKTCLTKWQENSSHNFSLKRAASMLKYLKSCEKIEPLNEAASSLINDLSSLTKDYSSFTKTQMKNYYSTVFNSSNITKAELLSSAEELMDRSEEIFTLKDKFPMLFLIFDPKEKLAVKWQKKLTKGAAKLSGEMARLTIAENFHLLHGKILAVKNLCQLDDMLGEPLFSKIYHKYQGQFDVNAFQVFREGIEAVTDYNYPTVLAKISYLSRLEMEMQPQRRVHSDQLKTILGESLRQLMEEVRSKATFVFLQEDVDLEKIKSMVKQLKLIIAVKNFTLEHPIIEEKIDEYLLEIKRILSYGILNQLSNIQKLINNRKFPDVVIRKKNMILVCNTLGEFCDMDQYPDIRIQVDEEFEISLRSLFDNLLKDVKLRRLDGQRENVIQNPNRSRGRKLLDFTFFHKFFSIFSKQSTDKKHD